MPRKLAIVTGSGLLLCAAFLGLAVVIGGDDIFHDARSLERVKPLVDLATRKEWRWQGGDTLALDAPINIRYRPSGPPQVSVSGPAELLEHVQVGDGRIGSDRAVSRNSGKRLDAVISGMAIRKFVVNGTENLDLGEIDQSNLDLHINGTGTVHGRGKVERLKLTISGPGNADLGGLSVGDAKIAILGSGDATLSPHGSVKLFIAGSGKLKLLTQPAELKQTIVGSGTVNQLAQEITANVLQSVDVARIASEATRNALNNVPIPPIPPGNAGVPDSQGGAIFVQGSHDADLGHIEQKSLTITVTHSGTATAEGKVDDLAVTVLGSGDARLGKLAARNVSVQIMGSGDATVAPSGELKVTIMGSGDVHLRTRPARIERTIMGSGRVIEEY